MILLRSAQEALANVRKHSRATSTVVNLAVVDGRVALTVQDDGGGFDPSSPQQGYGLPGLRDRLTLASGELDLTSSPGTGTTLVVTLPLRVGL